ncbi:phage tail protein [Azospirillum sp. B4]|uniref:phage tail protein n=1 Tax=Azospirillum sp. B4 TaxID=95605 RepID=UPI0003494641|nr:tail fiber protein [Azospirillum sp. B4]
MADAFFGEIRAFAFTYAPQDWAFCWGQQYLVGQFQALYTIIGTLYGGSPNVNFNVPDLRGRVTAGTGTVPVTPPPNGPLSYNISTVQGVNSIALTQYNMPSHNHQAVGGPSKLGVSGGPVPNSYVGVPRKGNVGYDGWSLYSSVTNPTTLSQSSLTTAYGNAGGGADPHTNVSPYLALNFCICMNGDVYPTKN